MSKAAHRILLVEDEADSAEMLTTFLEMNGFNVVCFLDGAEALRFLDNPDLHLDLAVLDIMVPGADGRELCSTIRRHPGLREIPVIFLTAKDEEQDEIAGLSLGADDYIGKPASLNLILAHIRSLLRRRSTSTVESRPVAEQSLIKIDGVELNRSAYTVYNGRASVELTAREFSLLELLMRNPKKVFTRQEILDFISDDESFVFDRTVDVHVKNIRLKLGEAGRIIRTYRGQGYGIDRELQ